MFISSKKNYTAHREEREFSVGGWLEMKKIAWCAVNGKRHTYISYEMKLAMKSVIAALHANSCECRI